MRLLAGAKRLVGAKTLAGAERLLACTAVALIAAGAAGAVTRYGGASDAGELQLPGSALSLVAGPSAAGLVADAPAVWDNPARMGINGGAGAMATCALLPGGLSDSQIGGSISMGEAGTFGAALRLVQATLTRTTEDGAGAYGGPSGSFSYQTFVGTGAWAPDLGDALGVPVRAGLSLTFVTRQVADETASGGGGGAGIWVPCGSGIGGFAAVRNVGWTRAGVWPSEVVAGASLEHVDLLVSGVIARASVAGVWSFRERGLAGSAGGEIGLGNETVGCALRAGYTMGTVRAVSAWPAGGLVVRIGTLAVEAGIGNLGDLGLARIMTLSYRQAAADTEPVSFGGVRY